jgi:hypothetical protein
MKSDLRAPVIRLLTDPEAARVLNLSASEIDHIVQVGGLRAVHVSARGGRRFWPADVAAAAAVPSHERSAPPAITTAEPSVLPVIASPTPVAAPRRTRSAAADPETADRGTADRGTALASRFLAVPARRPRRHGATAPPRARWQPYAAATERQAPTYLAFRDAEHVTGYLRARSKLDLAPEPPARADHRAVSEPVTA